MDTVRRVFSPDIPTAAIASLPDNAVLVDVREEAEWVLGHAPAAVHLPLGELSRRIDELPVTRPLVITCRSGRRSAQAVSYLQERGYDAVSLDGGMLAWVQANRPLRHDGFGAPAVD